MKRKSARGEFIEGFLARARTGGNIGSSFYTSMFRSTFEGLRNKFRELSENL